MFFNKIENEDREHFSTRVADALNNALNNMDSETFIKHIDDALQDYTAGSGAVGRGDYYLLPPGAWFNPFFYMYLAGLNLKHGIRNYNLSEIKGNVTNGMLSIRTATIEILDSLIGQTDIRSFKYFFLNKLTGLTAQDPAEASELLTGALNYLKNENPFTMEKVESDAYTKENIEETFSLYNVL